MTNPELADRLRSSGVEEEAIQLLLDPNPSWQKHRVTGKQNRWKILVGVLKIIIGIFFLLVALFTGRGLFMGIVILLSSFAWFASYNRDNI